MGLYRYPCTATIDVRCLSDVRVHFRRFRCGKRTRCFQRDPFLPSALSDPSINESPPAVCRQLWWSSVACSSLIFLDPADAADAVAKRYGGFLSPISDTLEAILNGLQNGLEFLHVPYSYGFSIILLTVIVKLLTFPFTKKQVLGDP